MTIDLARQSWNAHKDDALLQAIRHTRLPLCVTDPHLPDNPLVYVNDAFCEMTGYSEDEVIGRNCRFLQGTETTGTSVNRVRDMLASQDVATIEILNYRKDGSAFVNALQIGPIYDSSGKLILFFGSQVDITAQHEAEQTARDLANSELLHRLKNIVNVMSVIVRLTAHEERDPGAFGRKTLERLTALSELHFKTLQTSDSDTPQLEDLAGAILAAYAPRHRAQFTAQGPAVALPRVLLTPLTLVLHELAANAVKHGSLSTVEGHVDLSWTVSEGAVTPMLTLTWQETGGPSVSMPDAPSGSRIISTMIASVHGALTFDWNAGGLIATVKLPLTI